MDAANSRLPDTWRLTGHGLVLSAAVQGESGWWLLPQACGALTLTARTFGVPPGGANYQFTLVARHANGSVVSVASCGLTSAARTCSANGTLALVAGESLAIQLANTHRLTEQQPQGAMLVTATCR